MLDQNLALHNNDAFAILRICSNDKVRYLVYKSMMHMISYGKQKEIFFKGGGCIGNLKILRIRKTNAKELKVKLSLL